MSYEKKLEISDTAFQISSTADELPERYMLAFHLFRHHSAPETATRERTREFVKAFLYDRGFDNKRHVAANDESELGILALLGEDGDSFPSIELAQEMYVHLLGKTYITARETRFCILSPGKSRARDSNNDCPLMGCMQHGVEVGDEVHVIPGFHFPMLVRKVDDEGSYRFAGICYVHHFMDGEALLSDGNERAITIV